MSYARGLCLDCYNFRTPRFGHAPGPCTACTLHRPLKRGYCRSCWCQARLERAERVTDARSAVVLAPYLPGIRHHQLFLAGYSRRTAKPRTIERRRGTKGRPPKTPPAPAPAPAPTWFQPTLFETPGRNYRARRLDLRANPAPDNPYLAHALHLAHQRSEARGWLPEVRRNMQRVLVPLLTGHIPGERIKASDARVLARRHSAALDAVLEIIDDLGLLDHDLPATLDTWLQRVLAPLTPNWSTEILAWANELRHGTPRRRPRDPATVYILVRQLLPPLTDWSSRLPHLRAVTASDLTDYCATLHGHHRQTTRTALRSLFGWAKRTRRIFHDPTRGLTAPARAPRLWQPLPDEALDAAVKAARTDQARVYLALAAIHGARAGQIRALQLHDVDLPHNRLTIGGVTRPLDDLTRTVLERWLDHRRARWPHTANTHLLISKESALGHRSVSPTFVIDLRSVGLTFEQLRIDRRLTEALATGGDPALFLAVFGGDDQVAARYAANARLLLQPDHDPTSVSRPGTPGPKSDNSLTAHPSSL
ncbi:site-specific integrase [Streptomyces sp. BH104]|uniref:site-specific integrase n=1 Tax=Streptomyces sp. BH104 TaxID=3410407 RepID=UPI003BB7F7EE